MIEEICSFDLLVYVLLALVVVVVVLVVLVVLVMVLVMLTLLHSYADEAAAVPQEWEESDPKACAALLHAACRPAAGSCCAGS